MTDGVAVRSSMSMWFRNRVELYFESSDIAHANIHLVKGPKYS